VARAPADEVDAELGRATRALGSGREARGASAVAAWLADRALGAALTGAPEPRAPPPADALFARAAGALSALAMLDAGPLATAGDREALVSRLRQTADRAPDAAEWLRATRA
jgi:hypothetical protein